VKLLGARPKQLSYQEKVTELNSLSAQGTGAIRLDNKSFMKFVEHPRNYSLIVVFTATDATQPCDICRCVASPVGPLRRDARLIVRVFVDPRVWMTADNLRLSLAL